MRRSSTSRRGTRRPLPRRSRSGSPTWEKVAAGRRAPEACSTGCAPGSNGKIPLQVNVIDPASDIRRRRAGWGGSPDLRVDGNGYLTVERPPLGVGEPRTSQLAFGSGPKSGRVVHFKWKVVSLDSRGPSLPGPGLDTGHSAHDLLTCGHQTDRPASGRRPP